MWEGIDGCNAPNYGMPLHKLAFLYARLGAAKQTGCAQEIAMSELSHAMAESPILYSGNDKPDNALTALGAGRWVSKTGAEGVRCVALSKAGLGLALKGSDDNANASFGITIEIMRQLDLLTELEIKNLRKWHLPELTNCIGTKTGIRNYGFKLKFT